MLVSHNLNKIVPSLAISLVILFSFSVLLVSQPATYDLPNAQDEHPLPPGTPLSSFWFYWDYDAPVVVSRGGSATMSVEIRSSVDKPISMILTLNSTDAPPRYVTWESQFVNIPWYGRVNNNITISASDDAPLGDVFVILGADGYESGLVGMAGSLRLTVVEKVDIPEFPSWASLVLAFAIPIVMVIVCQRKLTSARNRDIRNRDSV